MSECAKCNGWGVDDVTGFACPSCLTVKQSLTVELVSNPDELGAAIQADAAPVDNRVSTSIPVDDREPENTSDKADTAPAVKSETGAVSDKLRPAVEVWREAWRSVALLSSEHEDVRLNEAVAELHRVIEADREAVRAEQAAELAKYKALAETLAFMLEAGTRFMPSSATVWHREAAKALRQYKEARDV